MFDLERFEKIVYKTVTKGVNALVAEIPQTSSRAAESAYLKLHSGILNVLLRITEETVSQIMHGIVLNMRSLNK